MIRDPASARDSMVRLFEASLATIDWASFGFPGKPDVYYEGVGGSGALDLSKSFFRWAAHHDASDQATLGDQSGNRVFGSQGMIVIQCACPLLNGQGFTGAERMAIIARNAYRGKQTPDCIWFTEAKIQEVGQDGGFYIFNTSAVFHYDEVA